MFGIDDALVIPALSSAASAALSYFGTESTNQANRDNAQAQMQYQERLSNTSYQRAVSDMSAAGLNPMLAYSQGGATTPAGAMAQMQNSLGNAVSSAQVGSKVIPEIEQVRAQTANVGADTEKKQSETALNNTQAAINAVLVPYYEQQTRTSGSSAGHFEAMSARVKREVDLDKPYWETAREMHQASESAERARLYRPRHEADVRELVERAKLHGASAALHGTQDIAQGLQLPRLRNEAAAEETLWKEKVAPYLGDAARVGSSAAHLRFGARGLRR